ncbi:MAG TPA: hypothetical protein VGF80_14425 [Galbitalea sp.]|jgi:hypothetical protein
MRKSIKATVGVAAAALLVAGLGFSATTATASVPTKSSSSLPGPVAAVPELKGGNTAVKLDANFLAALKSLGVTPGVLGNATLTDGSVHFPITGGDVVYWSPKGSYRPYVQGLILHAGSGLSLTAGSTVVSLTDFKVNPGNSQLYGNVSVNGTLAAADAPLFKLDGSTLKALKLSGSDAILTGTTVHISATAADLLDKTFNTTGVKAGLLVGVATITAQIK